MFQIPFYLSSFRPVKVLKENFSNSLAAVSLRKGLVVLQFAVSVALIISGQVSCLRTSIAIAVAIPVTWLAMNKWLQGFISHIPVSLGVFILTAVINLVIALSTISIQAVIAALANPVKHLKNE